MELIYVTNAEHEMDPPTSLKHRFELLDQRKAQQTDAHGSDWRFSFRIVRFNFEAKLLMIEQNGLFKVVYFKEKKIKTGNHQSVRFFQR